MASWCRAADFEQFWTQALTSFKHRAEQQEEQ